MEENFFYAASYRSSSEPWDVPTAKATAFVDGRYDYAEHDIDLNEQLIKNKAATFFMRVNSDAMIGAGIHSGDVVIVDRSLEAKNGKVVIAVLDGEMVIRRLEIGEGKRRLLPATKKLSAIEISDPNSFSIWGVVTYVIHSL